MNYYIILGKNGKIARNIIKGITFNSNKVISINWIIIKKILSSNINIKEYIEHQYNIHEKDFKFIVINCLKDSINPLKNKERYQKFKEIFKEFTFKVTYIYISTFECDKFALTRYRKIKNHMENIIKNDKGYIVRVGYFIEDKKILNSHRNKIILSDNQKRIILLPVTYANDLTEFINKNIFLKSNKKVFSIYSKFYALNINIYYPFFYFVDLDQVETYNFYKFPLEYLSKSLFYFAKIIRHFKLNNYLLDLLEKPYSLYLQQKIIYKKLRNNGK